MPDMESLASLHVEEEMLNEYLDGVLDNAAKDAVTEHLTGCAACAGRLEALHGVFQALDALPEASLERDLTRNVLARIALPAVFSKRTLFLLGLEVICAAALAIVFWPSIEAGLTTDIYWQAGEAAASGLTQFLAGWQEMFTALAEQLILLEQWMPQWSSAPFSTLQVALLLAISAFAWLAVNGRLLGASRAEKKFR